MKSRLYILTTMFLAAIFFSTPAVSQSLELSTASKSTLSDPANQPDAAAGCLGSMTYYRTEFFGGHINCYYSTDGDNFISVSCADMYASLNQHIQLNNCYEWSVIGKSSFPDILTRQRLMVELYHETNR